MANGCGPFYEGFPKNSTGAGKAFFGMRIAMRMLVLAGVLAAVLGAAAAEDEFSGGSFLTPFPDKDVYQVKIVGDSLADGLVSGLTDAFKGDSRVQVSRKAASLPGLMRTNFEGEIKDLEEALRGETLHAAVVMVGAWDRASIRNSEGRRFYPGSEEWKAEYGRRVSVLVRMLKQKKLAVYWVSLPIMRRPNANDDAQIMNEVIRQRVYLAGQKFIDIYPGFAGESGNYDPYGPDITGKVRLLREGDGIHFTEAGSRKLAHFIERELKRDIAAAKAERTVPLAGDEIEQARVGGGRPEAAPAAGTGDSKAGAGAPSALLAPKHALPPLANGAAGGQVPGDLKAGNGRVTVKVPGSGGAEETAAVEILRPAIPASVLALVTRRESPDRPSQMGESLIDQIPGGLTVMSSITPAGNARHRTSPTQAPFYRVLVRGERMTPRPGRADDATWPRPESQPAALSPSAAVGRFALPAAGAASAAEKQEPEAGSAPGEQ